MSLLGYESEAVPLGLEDLRLVVEGLVNECGKHRSVSRIHMVAFLVSFPSEFL